MEGTGPADTGTRLAVPCSHVQPAVSRHVCCCEVAHSGSILSHQNAQFPSPGDWRQGQQTGVSISQCSGGTALRVADCKPPGPTAKEAEPLPWQGRAAGLHSEALGEGHVCDSLVPSASVGQHRASTGRTPPPPIMGTTLLYPPSCTA